MALYQFDVHAKENSVSGSGRPKETNITLSRGDTLVITVPPTQRWNAGSNLWSNANGLDNSHLHTIRGFTCLAGSLVGSLDNGRTFFFVGTRLELPILLTTGTLSLYYWDTDSDNNSGFVTATVVVTKASSADSKPLSARASLDKLIQGYDRFKNQQPLSNNITLGEIKKHADHQHPFAIILACADSRVPPEIIFDQKIGDLFVIRVAGNVADDASVLGSIQYAIQHLNVKLVLVLGHERCGAIKAALSVGGPEKKGFSGPLGQLLSGIAPLVEPVYRRRDLIRGQEVDANILDQAVRVNIRRQISVIRDALVNLGQESLTLDLWLNRILVVGARYDLDDGKVEFIEAPVPPDPKRSPRLKRLALLTSCGMGIIVAEPGGRRALAVDVNRRENLQNFELVELESDQFALKTVFGNYVNATADGRVIVGNNNISDAVRLRFIKVGDKRVALQFQAQAQDRYFRAPPTGDITSVPEMSTSTFFRIVEVDE